MHVEAGAARAYARWRLEARASFPVEELPHGSRGTRHAVGRLAIGTDAKRIAALRLQQRRRLAQLRGDLRILLDFDMPLRPRRAGLSQIKTQGARSFSMAA